MIKINIAPHKLRVALKLHSDYTRKAVLPFLSFVIEDKYGLMETFLNSDELALYRQLHSRFDNLICDISIENHVIDYGRISNVPDVNQTYLQGITLERKDKKLKSLQFLTKIHSIANQIKTITTNNKSIDYANELLAFRAKSHAIVQIDEYIQYIEFLKNKSLRDRLFSIFNYDRFYSNTEWNGVKFLESINLKVCPYCNKNYITVYTSSKNNKVKTHCDLDHFYPKKYYPYLAVSFYNLIPSCSACNSRHKKDKDPNEEDYKLINPFVDGIEEKLQFKTTFNKCYIDLDYLYGLSTNFEIQVLNPENQIEVKNSINMFSLKDTYQVHKDEVMDIIRYSHIYTDEYVATLSEDFPDLKLNREDIFNMVIGLSYDENSNTRRPLSKLKKDIAHEFGIIL